MRCHRQRGRGEARLTAAEGSGPQRRRALNVTVPVGVPPEPATVAVKLTDCPNTDGFEALLSVVVVGRVTVSVVLPLTPSSVVAVMTLVPPATPVAKPAAVMLATPGVPVLHVA